MTTYSVGKEVLAYCGKCKLKLSHLIMALKSTGAIAKCQCKTCGATHGFKESATKARTKAGTRTRKTRSKKVEVPIGVKWAEGMERCEELFPYSIRTTFKAGDGINHPKFGEGFVEEVVDSSKINVVFQHEIKTLVHAK